MAGTEAKGGQVSHRDSFLVRHLPEGMRRRISIKAGTLEEFISLVRQYGGSRVTAEGIIADSNTVTTTSVGRLGVYKYATLFTSQTPNGRYINYIEPNLQLFRSEYGFADYEDRQLAALRGLITADARLKEVQEQLPTVITALTSARGDFDQATLKLLYSDARKHNIQPYPKPQASQSK